jgi:hypothetical protein
METLLTRSEGEANHSGVSNLPLPVRGPMRDQPDFA